MLPDLVLRRSVTRDWHRFYPIFRATCWAAAYSLFLSLIGANPVTAMIFTALVWIGALLSSLSHPSRKAWEKSREQAERAVRQCVDANLVRLYGEHLSDREDVYVENKVHRARVDGQECKVVLIFGDRGAVAYYVPQGGDILVEVPRADLRGAHKP